MADPREPIDEIEDEDLLEDEGTDAGRVNDEGGDDAEAGQELEEDQAASAGPAQERVRRRDDVLREELRAEREHRARVEAELNIIRQEREARTQQRPQGESEEQFQARIALLDPEMRSEARYDRARKINEQQTALAVFAAADRADKATYDSKAAVNALYRKHAAAVEATMAQARQRGMDINRETALGFVVGQFVLQNQGKVSPARQQAQRRVESQQARTTGGRGDQGREQRPRRYAANDSSPEAVRARLEAPDAFI